MDHCQQMCFMKFFFLWFVVILRTTDGGSVTWFEPPPVEVITDSTATPIVNRNLTKGFEEKLSWNFSLTVDLSLITVTLAFQASSPGSSFENVATYVQTVGTANVQPGFEDQFNVSWIPSKITLTIFNATTKNNGEFECRLLLFDGRITITWRRKIQVTVLVPPNITSITESQTVNEGETLTLSCAADGITPKPNITWTRLSDNRVVINNIWTLNNISRQENGTYRCTADNGVGSPAVKDVIITVHYKPDTVTLKANATENNDCSDVLWINFTCVASEAKPPVDGYQLFGNGDLTSSSGTWTQEISEIGKHDFSCLAQHPLGNVTSSKNVTVTFNVPVQISANLITGSNTPRRGEDVALCCNASGFPEPSITWSKVLSNALVEINSSKCLNFTNIKEDKSGMYVCQANNTCGKQNSSVISINVLHEPENVILNASISSGKVCAAKMVKFTCKAGAAEPEVDNYALYQNDAVIANMRGYGVFTLWLNTSGHFIYMCKANNSVGTGTSNNITFTVEVPSLVVYINDSIVVREDEDAILFCSASGSPPPSISWVNVKTGVSKEGATLLLTNLTEENQGDVYKCVASNGCGNDSKSTAIDVQHLPKNVKLNLSISDDKVCTGNMVQFTCKAGAANPEVESYTLYRNGSEIPNMNSSGVSTLWLNTSGHFIYKCEANNSEGTGSSNSISVTVEEGASVTSENGSIVRVKEGENVTLSCIPSGVPLPNVSWSYSRNDMLEFGSTLLVPNINRALNGSAIECSASNACGSDSKPTYVIVQYAPESINLSKNIASDDVCEGNMVQFTCKAGAANPEVERYTLYRNNTEIANMSSSGVSTLWLNTSGHFIYKCEADNSVGTGTSNSVSVAVEGPFSVTSVSPNEIVVNEGDNVTLSCNVTGDPTVIWVYTRTGEVNSGSTWTLPKINRTRNGTYSCVASNACGRVNKTTAIVVQYIGRNVSEELNMTVKSGGNATLTCLVDGYPEPNITWYNGNGIVENSLLVGKALVFNPSKEADTGCYTCFASNDAGEVNVTRCLTVVDEPTSTTPAQSEEKIHSGELPLKKINGKELVYKKEYKDLNNAVTKRVTGPFKDKMDETYRNEATTEVTELRKGSVIVSFNLIFTNPVTTNEAFAKLRSAIVNGTFGPFEVGALTVVSTPTTSPATSASDERCEESFFKKEDCSVKLAVAVGISVAAVVLIVIIVAVIGYCIHKERKCRKDTRIAHHPGCEEQRLQGDDRYGQVNNGYAETGPPSANSTEKAAAAVPDYAVVDKSAKKKKKNEKVDDTYAKVDMSKKRSKKKPRPGEDVLYADLGDFNGTSQMPAVATSPKALPPIKKPDPYEGTQYADITQFLKGDAILPKNEKQDDKQATEMKEKDEKADGAGGENAPKETPM